MDDRPLYDFSDYTWKDLFYIRDAMAILDKYGLANEDMYRELLTEIGTRETDRKSMSDYLENLIVGITQRYRKDKNVGS